MRYAQTGSKRSDTGLRFCRSWKVGSVVLRQLGVALIAVNAYGQPAYLSSPKELLETDPRGFLQWLQSNRPKPVSADDKARSLAGVSSEGEVTNLDAASQRKLAALKPLLRAIGRDSAWDIKVVDARLVRIGLYERGFVLITEGALRVLGAEELQAQVAHEIGHEYMWVDHQRASAREDRQRLKDLELLCDAIAIATLHGLGADPSRLITGVEKGTRYNLKVLRRAVDDRSYPALSERREFARAVTAWVTRRRSSG